MRGTTRRRMRRACRHRTLVHPAYADAAHFDGVGQDQAVFLDVAEVNSRRQLAGIARR